MRQEKAESLVELRARDEQHRAQDRGSLLRALGHVNAYFYLCSKIKFVFSPFSKCRFSLKYTFSDLKNDGHAQDLAWQRCQIGTYKEWHHMAPSAPYAIKM